jgi:Carboxypeptidase regulatory-like domain
VAVLPGALVRATSPSLTGGPATMTTNERGQLRFPVLLPGTYVLDIELAGFAPYHEVNITSARARRSNGQSY